MVEPEEVGQGYSLGYAAYPDPVQQLYCAITRILYEPAVAAAGIFRVTGVVVPVHSLPPILSEV